MAHAAGVRQVLESRVSNEPSAVGLHLSEDSMAKDPDIRPHDLSGYTVGGEE